MLASLTAVVIGEPDPPLHAGPLQRVISGLLRKDPAVRLGPADTERLLRQVAAARRQTIPLGALTATAAMIEDVTTGVTATAGESPR